MIDLHLHLDGSLSIEDFIFLADKTSLKLGEDFPNNIYVNKDCKSLEEYLLRFELPLTFLQDKENIEYAVESLVNRLYKLGYIYAEIRFAPLLHLNKGLTQEEVIIAAVSGLEKGLKDKTNFDANLILCLMRQVDDSTNLDTIKALLDVKSPKVVAIDLAGPEAFKDTSEYQHLFDFAKANNVNIIIHAGEACGNDSILKALDLGAKRIGHGVHLSLNKENIEIVKDITFEFCPTSNIQTTSLSSYEDNPIRQFIKNNLKVTVNSDNMTVSNVDVLHEFKMLYKAHNLTKEDVYNLLKNSILASFVTDKKKEEMITLLNERIDDYYDSIIK